MSAKFRFWDIQSEALSAELFDRYTQSSEILEQDKHGTKVMRLTNGDMLKVFRIKSIFSIARIYSYARQFCRNAKKLQRLNIPTVAVVKLFHLIGTNKSAVQYHPLQGSTLRQLAQNQKFTSELLEQLGAFVADLHTKGVYFRSLHMGNIVLTESGDYGLIDIADLHVHRSALSYNKCYRNFQHFFRVKSDRDSIDKEDWQVFVASYIAQSSLKAKAKFKMQRYLLSDGVTKYFKTQ